MLNSSFSTHDVLQVTGASARQLQWWDERRLVVPAREGRNRIYSTRDLIDILVIMELRGRHISLQQVRRVLRFLRAELGARFADLVTDDAERHLLLDGQRIYLETDTRQIVDLMRNAKQPVFLICLTDAVKRLRIDVEVRHENATEMHKKSPRSAKITPRVKEAG